jgi:GT2 family glycosyltransferase
MTKTAVVILNWNGRSFLEQFLPEVVKHTLAPETEVIVADNGSEDDSVEWVTTNQPEVRVISLGSNHGYAGGYNRALKQIEAEFYILLNSDVLVEAGWAEKLITFMVLHPNVGACQPKIRSYSNTGSFEYAGAAGGYIDRLGYPFCRGRIFETIEDDHGQYNDTREIFWASGSCIAVRGAAFDQCDGFDESFFVPMEEIGRRWRMQHAGYTSLLLPPFGGLSRWRRHTWLRFSGKDLLQLPEQPDHAGKESSCKTYTQNHPRKATAGRSCMADAAGP